MYLQIYSRTILYRRPNRVQELLPIGFHCLRNDFFSIKIPNGISTDIFLLEFEGLLNFFGLVLLFVCSKPSEHTQCE